jgi:hypothetical protein
MGHRDLDQSICCEPKRNPQIRDLRAQPARGIRVILTVLTLAGLAGPATVSAASAAPVSAHVSSVQTPLELLSAVLDLIYRLLGGDPRELEDPQLSITTRMNIVRGQYETYGIPQDLTSAERIQLLDAISESHNLLQSPMLPVVEKAAELFDAALDDMWYELGGAPGGLVP